jgi:hypothetical protein
MVDNNLLNVVRPVNPLIEEHVREWVSLAHGEFKLNDMLRELNYVDSHPIEEAKYVIKRLLFSEEIKEVKNKNGHYKKTNIRLKKMRKVKDRKPDIDLWWPLNLHEKTVVIRGALIIIAGVSNAGKSAFLLNFTEKNMHKHKIRYVSSEWSNEERDIQLEDYGANIDEWDSKVDFYAKKDVSASFDNYIDPENITIIDYYESYENYGAIAGDLRDISDKLTTGIAIVAMQKKAGHAHAYGGEGTVNRSQLYINIDFNELHPHKRIATIRKLKKAKERQYSIERLSCEFEYDKNGRICNQSDWGKIVELKKKGQLIEKYIESEPWANTPINKKHYQEEDEFEWK